MISPQVSDARLKRHIHTGCRKTPALNRPYPQRRYFAITGAMEIIFKAVARPSRSISIPDPFDFIGNGEGPQAASPFRGIGIDIPSKNRSLKKIPHVIGNKP
jgi:hypothetical protein